MRPGALCGGTSRVLAIAAVMVLSGCASDDPAATTAGPPSRTPAPANSAVTTVATTTIPTPPPTTVATTTLPPTTSTAVAALVHVFPLNPSDAGSYSPGGHAYPATDIFAAAGTPFVAVTSGVIQGVSRVDVWDPEVDDGATKAGLFVSLIGDDGVRYYGSHLLAVAGGIETGVRVDAGRLLGNVGSSGNAVGTPPHLHFGISRPTTVDDWEVRRGEVDPVPFLDAWLAGDTTATPDLPGG
ncbi:MAG: M23 family metallopeptidase [Actinomycetota bacterium]|nr:M23 family metallopeptidase [Actinomycetota bacterium]